MSNPVTVWLVPAEPARAELLRQIAALAAEHGTVPFPPHVTLFTTEAPVIDPRSWDHLLAQIAARHSPLTLEPTGTSHSDEFSKTLFFQFRPSPQLTALQGDVSRSASPGAEYQFSPHMSLLYKELTAEVRASLAQRIPLPGPIPADTLVAVIPGESGDWHDVAGWREIASRRLSLATSR
jgi:2'-5' RNA ligase